MQVLCDVMEVSRSGYYQYLKTPMSSKSLREIELIAEVKAIASLSKNSYGSRQMAKHLKNKGYPTGRYAARTLMRKAGVSCKQRRCYRNTTDSNHSLPVADNVLNREFLEGWVYVAAVLDLFSRRIVGFAIAEHMRESLINDALQMALSLRQPEAGLLHHSDQGVQYASDNYQETLKTANITVSMSRKANCWDNAVMERFWGSLKSERTDGRIYVTREEAKNDVIDYIQMWYNPHRLHSTLGYLSPVQFENQFLLNKLSVFT